MDTLPAQPGSLAQLSGDPLAGMEELTSSEFDFAQAEDGPLGPYPQERFGEIVAPYIRPSRTIGFPTTATTLYRAIDITAPQLWLPSNYIQPATIDTLDISVVPLTPDIDPVLGASPLELTALGANLYFAQPGRYYLSFVDGVGAGALTFIVVDATDPRTVAMQLDKTHCRELMVSNDFAIAALGIADVVNAVSAFGRRGCVISNSGANSARIGFGPNAPAAAVGYLLAAGAQLDLTGYHSVTRQRIRAFSTAGTSINVLEWVGPTGG